MDIACIISHIAPNASYVINNNNYDEIIWNDQSIPKPSMKDIESAWPEVKNKMFDENQKRLRRESLSIEADPLYFGWKRGENSEQEWLDKVSEIRSRYPYHSEV